MVAPNKIITNSLLWANTQSVIKFLFACLQNVFFTKYLHKTKNSLHLSVKGISLVAQW